MALRDPRNKSRNNASRRTTSATRSRRAATSSKYNPKPTSSSQRSGKNTGSQRVTQGKGGEVKSPRLKQALDGVKTKRTPAKTPPKSKPVKTNPASSTPRGAQGPRTAPRQGPYQRPPSAIRSEVTKPKPKAPPKSATPRVSNVGTQTRQARAVQQANPGRAARAARRAGTVTRVARAAVRNPGLAIAAADVATRRVTDGTLKNKPTGQQRGQVATPKGPAGNKPKVDKTPVKAPPKKDSTVLAKRNGKEGVLRNGVFYPTGWSPAQRNRYQIQKNK